jgi:hypothetical protein
MFPVVVQRACHHNFLHHDQTIFKPAGCLAMTSFNGPEPGRETAPGTWWKLKLPCAG